MASPINYTKQLIQPNITQGLARVSYAAINLKS